MKAFRERFQQHPLQTSLNDLRAGIEQVRLPKYSEGEVSENLETLRTRRDAFARFLRVSSYVTQTLNHADASIWKPSAMNVAQTAVNQLKAGLDQFNATQLIAHLESAADTALDQYRGAFIPRLKIKSKEAADAFTKFCEKAEETIRSLEEQDRAIKDKEIEIAKAHDAFTTQIAGLGAQIESFKTQFEAQKSRVDDLVTTQSQLFQTSQTERSSLFTQEPYLEKLNDDPAMREILKQKADSYFMGQNHREPDDDLDGAKSSREMRRFEDRMMELMKTAIAAIAKR